MNNDSQTGVYGSKYILDYENDLALSIVDFDRKGQRTRELWQYAQTRWETFEAIPKQRFKHCEMFHTKIGEIPKIWSSAITNHARCGGCGMHNLSRAKPSYLNEKVFVTIFKSGMIRWFCTHNCLVSAFDTDSINFCRTGLANVQQIRCMTCQKHRKKVKKHQPLRTHTHYEFWFCSKSCKEKYKNLLLLKEI